MNTFNSTTNEVYVSPELQFSKSRQACPATLSNKFPWINILGFVSGNGEYQFTHNADPVISLNVLSLTVKSPAKPLVWSLIYTAWPVMLINLDPSIVNPTLLFK